MKPGKEQIKRIRKLFRKKYRLEYGQFVVERWKIIRLFLDAGFRPVHIWSVRPPGFATDAPWTLIDRKTLDAMSALQNPYDAIAVFPLPEQGKMNSTGLIPVLDDVQDPGNLGTIIRTADWFGVRTLVCSPGSADAFNPKTIQASMGSLARVKVFYRDPLELTAATDLPVYGTSIQGKSVYNSQLPRNMFLILGNEGHGIRSALETQIQHFLSIPRDPHAAAESLNVAQAAGIFMAEWFRQNIF